MIVSMWCSVLNQVVKNKNLSKCCNILLEELYWRNTKRLPWNVTQLVALSNNSQENWILSVRLCSLCSAYLEQRKPLLVPVSRARCLYNVNVYEKENRLNMPHKTWEQQNGCVDSSIQNRLSSSRLSQLIKQSAGGQKSTIMSINGQTVARSSAFYGYRYGRVTFIISTSLWIWEVVNQFFQQHYSLFGQK